MAQQASFQAIGTLWDIQVDDDINDEAWSQAMAQVHARIDAFDSIYSRFRPDSLVARMAKEGGRHELPPDGYALLKFYERLYRATDGMVTPLIGQAMADAGYDAAYSLREQPLKATPAWEDVISYDEHTISLTEPALLDFGAAGKGYLVDIVAALLTKQGLVSFTINAGGDILHRSATAEPLQVGLENPQDTSEAVGVAELGNASLCASAGSKRKWGSYHHLIDPKRLVSPQTIAATWVIAGDTMTADGLATALFFCPPQSLQSHFSFSYAILTSGMELTHSGDFPAQLFSKTEQ